MVGKCTCDVTSVYSGQPTKPQYLMLDASATLHSSQVDLQNRKAIAKEDDYS